MASPPAESASNSGLGSPQLLARLVVLRQPVDARRRQQGKWCHGPRSPPPKSFACADSCRCARRPRRGAPARFPQRRRRGLATAGALVRLSGRARRRLRLQLLHVRAVHGDGAGPRRMVLAQSGRGGRPGAVSDPAPRPRNDWCRSPPRPASGHRRSIAPRPGPPARLSPPCSAAFRPRGARLRRGCGPLPPATTAG